MTTQSKRFYKINMKWYVIYNWQKKYYIPEILEVGIFGSGTKIKKRSAPEPEPEQWLPVYAPKIFYILEIILILINMISKQDFNILLIF